MTPCDYAILGCYLALLLSISWVFRRFIHTTGDYFRSGGQVIWWMAGASAFAVSFSAWTFTGGASRAFGDGWPVMMIYLGNAAGFAGSALYFAPRFRQLRVVTAMQAVRARFGAGNERFFTWLTLPTRLMYAGIWLYGLGVFFSAALGMPIGLTLVLAGAVVTAIALIGGSWAVVASDFMQVLTLMPVTLVAAVLAVGRLGGAGAFLHSLSSTHLDFGRVVSDRVLLLWCVAILAKQFLAVNSLTEAPRYFSVKDSRHARRAALMAGVLMLGGLLVWFVPPMAASVAFPGLAGAFPGLRNPGEGSYFAMATATFPAGMLGLLVSGVFASTLSAMDAGLNNNAGNFIKSVYQPLLRPRSTERELLLASKATTLVFGAIIIMLALAMESFPGLTLFRLMLDFGILVALPTSLPLVLGIVIRRTPPWSGWSTVLVAFAAACLARHFLTADWAAGALGVTLQPAWARQNWDQAVAVLGAVAAGTAWFAASGLLYGRADASYREGIAAFSRDVDKPVDYDLEEPAPATDALQARLMGRFCAGYGAALGLLALVPNPPSGRLAFAACGVFVAGVGAVLVRSGRRRG